MGSSGGSRRPTGWMLASCVASVLLAAGCGAGGATPSAAPVATDRSAAATAAALPIRRVLDVAYLRNLLPASVVGIDPGTEVALDIYAPQAGGPWPVVVWAPGGEMTKTMAWAFGEELAARGAVVFAIDTVHAMAPDVAPLGVASRGLVEGAACAVRTARALAPAYGGDPARVVWSGASFGGIYGFELALSDPDWERLWTERAAANGGPGPTVECLTTAGSDRIDAIVTAGSGRFIEIWPTVYDADPAVRAFTDRVSHVGNDPALIVRLVHGDMDPEVPFAVAEGLERELTAAGYDVALTTVALGGHAPFFAQILEKIVEVVGSQEW